MVNIWLMMVHNLVGGFEPYPSENHGVNVSWDDIPFPTVSGKSIQIPWSQSPPTSIDIWDKPRIGDKLTPESRSTPIFGMILQVLFFLQLRYIYLKIPQYDDRNRDQLSIESKSGVPGVPGYADLREAMLCWANVCPGQMSLGQVIGKTHSSNGAHQKAL